jgi:transcription antitermination factor NusG
MVDSIARWSVAQIFSKRAHRIRQEMEDMGHGTFTPTYARHWISDGKPSSRESALFPGYIMFKTGAEDWARVGCVEGVIRVLRSAGSVPAASPVTPAEMYRMMTEDAMGVHNDIASVVVATEERRRRRRPRKSKRARTGRWGRMKAAMERESV